MALHPAQIWAERNYRMNVAGSTFTKLFGPDFDRIIPVYPTRVSSTGW